MEVTGGEAGINILKCSGNSLSIDNTQTDDLNCKKLLRDPKQPQKPHAYALFFRDTQAAIKGQNPNATFAQVSAIVSSMWDALDAEHKNVYKQKAEKARIEYIKAPGSQRTVMSIKTSVSDEQLMQDSVKSPRKNSILSPTNTTGNLESSSAFQTNQSIQSPPHDAIAENFSNANEVNKQVMNNNSGLTMENHTSTDASQKCIRVGCNNSGVVNPDWEDEYCSNECVIIHCRDVFSSWVKSNSLRTEPLLDSN